MNQDVFTQLSSCGKAETIRVSRDKYARVPERSNEFVFREGAFLMHSMLNIAGIGSSINPWTGGMILDQYIVPKGSVLDITSIVFSLRLDATFPQAAIAGSSNVADFTASSSPFYYGVAADDYYLDPTKNTFKIMLDRSTPFQHGLLYRTSGVVHWPAVPDTPVSPPSSPVPLQEGNLTRYNGIPVLNRNVMTKGDLSFHLIAKEDQKVEFVFETSWGSGPHAEVIVSWSGRLIPKTVWEEVIKVNR